MSLEQVKNLLSEFELSQSEVIPLERPLTASYYRQWLDRGLAADMDYLKSQTEQRTESQTHLKPFRSLIVITEPYFPWPQTDSTPLSSLQIAHYAKNRDYHLWFKAKLQSIIDRLLIDFPEEQFLAVTDSFPLLERDQAAQAGLGWFGKNTCLIHPQKGSLFFIGEILTTLQLENKPSPLPDFCGKCTACMDVCPTQALTEPRVLDANLCLAYWNIESKKIPPPEIRKAMGSWFFGCDLCQTVCPWNIKLHKLHPDFRQDLKNEDDVQLSREQKLQELRWLLTQSNKKILKHLKESPLIRAGGRGLKRNALIVIANERLYELRAEVQLLQKDPLLGELADWCLDHLN